MMESDPDTMGMMEMAASWAGVKIFDILILDYFAEITARKLKTCCLLSRFSIEWKLAYKLTMTVAQSEDATELKWTIWKTSAATVLFLAILALELATGRLTIFTVALWRCCQIKCRLPVSQSSSRPFQEQLSFPELLSKSKPIKIKRRMFSWFTTELTHRHSAQIWNTLVRKRICSKLVALSLRTLGYYFKIQDRRNSRSWKTHQGISKIFNTLNSNPLQTLWVPGIFSISRMHDKHTQQSVEGKLHYAVRKMRIKLLIVDFL